MSSEDIADPLGDIMADLADVEAMLAQGMDAAQPAREPLPATPQPVRSDLPSVKETPPPRPTMPSTEELARDFDALMETQAGMAFTPSSEIDLHQIATDTELKNIHEAATDTSLSIEQAQRMAPPGTPDPADRAIRAEALYQQGRREARGGDSVQAVLSFRAALALRADHAPAILALAMALSRSGSHTDAAHELRRLLPKLERGSERALVERAVAKLESSH